MTEKDLLTVFQKFGLANQPTTADEVEAVKKIAVEAVEVGAKEKYFLGHVIAVAALSAYKLGVINGKRAERARRKKAAIGAGTPTAAVDTMQNRQSVKCEYNTEARDMEGVNE